MSENTVKHGLCLHDYISHTGFGVLAKNIHQALAKTGRYTMDIVGINTLGTPYDREEWPGDVWPAVLALNQRYNDVYGRQQFVDRIVNNDYDFIFIIQDTFIVETFIDQVLEAISKKVKQPPIIYYFPIDAPPKESWVATVAKANFPVAYTHWAKDECLKWDDKLDHIPVIHHGINTKEFYHMDRDMSEFKSKWFDSDGASLVDDKFLLMNVNRNQSRKDVVRTFMILNELKKRGRNNVHLYMHMQQVDVGGDLNEMAKNFDLEFGADWSCPANFDAHSGVTVDSLNHLYNAADCLISTARGEGFGLTILEGAITKTPMILPNNTVIPELMANNRAFLVDAGDSISMWDMKEMDNERIRPLVNVEKAADAVERVMDGDLPDIEGAYTWALEHSWDNICKEWIMLFDAVQPNIVPYAGNEAVNGLGPAPGANRAERRRIERELRKKSGKQLTR